MQELKMKLKTGTALLKEMDSLKAPTAFGSGWLSGVSALLLVTIGLLSVLCLHYPNLLTVPEIQAAIDVSLFRVIIKIVLIVGFLLSCISLILRQNKLLGMTAVVLVMIAIVMGGSASMAVCRTSGNIYFGLDWFLLNWIMTGVLFLPLERLFRLVDAIDLSHRVAGESVLFFHQQYHDTVNNLFINDTSDQYFKIQ